MENRNLTLIIATIIISSIVGNLVQSLVDSPRNYAVIEEKVTNINDRLEEVIKGHATKESLKQLDARYEIEIAHTNLMIAKISEALERVQEQINENTMATKQLTSLTQRMQGDFRKKK